MVEVVEAHIQILLHRGEQILEKVELVVVEMEVSLVLHHMELEKMVQQTQVVVEVVLLKDLQVIR